MLGQPTAQKGARLEKGTLDVLVLNEGEVMQLLDLEELLDGLEDGFQALSAGEVTAPERNEVEMPAGSFLLSMPGVRPGGHITVKVVTVFEDNYGAGLPSHLATINLYDSTTGACVAFMDGTYITAIRTSASAALSTRLLARKNARVLTVLGAGVQGLNHLRVFPLRSRWQDVQPRGREQNAFLKTHSWEEYAAWHLGLTEGAAEETKARHAFVYGDFRRLHRMGLIACYYRAAEWRHKEIELAAHELVQHLDRKSAARRGGARSGGRVVRPEKLDPVFDVPDTRAEIVRVGAIEVHVPQGDAPRPAVLFVHGPVPADGIRPGAWPVYVGYCRLAASRGLVAATVDLDYVDYRDAAEVVPQLEVQIDEVRALPEVDAGRGALWAFSGGGLLVNRWLEEPPDWLRCVGLSYAMLQPPPPSVATPVVLTRVGRERREIQQTVDRFLASGAPVERIDVPNGRHAFDFLDDSDESRTAIMRALDAVEGHLAA